MIDFTEEDLRHLEQLTRLRLEGGSRETLREQLARIIDFVKQLENCETSTTDEPPGAVETRGAHMRDDVVQSCLSIEEALGGAPESGRNMFKVPPVIDTEEI